MTTFWVVLLHRGIDERFGGAWACEWIGTCRRWYVSFFIFPYFLHILVPYMLDGLLKHLRVGFDVSASQAALVILRKGCLCDVRRLKSKIFTNARIFSLFSIPV